MDRLFFHRITKLDHAMTVRLIRNECRSFMTRDKRAISAWRQVLWWFFTYPKSSTYVYLGTVDEKPAGYAAIRLDDEGKFWLSGGLLPTYRGKGLGSELFEFMITVCHQLGPWPIYLDVLTRNHRARALYEQLGFRPVNFRRGVLTMRL